MHAHIGLQLTTIETRVELGCFSIRWGLAGKQKEARADAKDGCAFSLNARLHA